MTEQTAPEFISRADFMKKAGLSIGGILLLNCLQACAPEDDVIPAPGPGTGTGGTALDFTLDLNMASNASLRNVGGFLVVSSQRVIVVRLANNNFLAVQSNCTHQGTTVTYRSGTNDFFCPNHGSVFSSSGSVVTGPATTPLRVYKFSFDVTANSVRVFA